MDVPGYAVITGAGSGIGRACASSFAKEGSAGVALLDINHEALLLVQSEIQTLLAQMPSLNGTPHKKCLVDIYPLNIADEHQVNTVVSSIAAKFGRIDYLVNAAGIAMKHPGGAAFVETPDWQRVMDVNLNGSFYMLRACTKIMLAQEYLSSSIDGRPLSKGSIVNFGSIQSVAGITLSTAYATTKAAILGLTRTASEDYANQGIRVNAICPGYTETPLTMANPLVKAAMDERVMSMVPMQRMGKPQELADGVLYLAGGRSSFVTGTALMVDGGYSSR